MRRIIRTAALLLACSLLLCAAAPCAAETAERGTADIITDMINAFGACGRAADPLIAALEDELRATDPTLADLWGSIIAYWEELNRTPVHPDRLPDGLPEDDSLCIVVLGYALASDGSMRPELIGRLETALTCARQYPRAYVLCTGGGTAAGNKDATEADRMGAWLAENGVAPERLIIENRSMSTTQNAVYSAELLRQGYPSVKQVAVVSSGYHIPWGQLLFEAVFLKNAALYGAPPVHAAANAGYMITNTQYTDTLRYQMSGLKSLTGR